MLRITFLVVGLLATTFWAGGCRSCQSCHDYDPPVADCDCHACGTHRAGSASGDYVGAYSEPVVDENGQPVEPAPEEAAPEL